MEYKEDVRTFLKRDFSVFAVRSGQNKADLVKVPVDRFKGIKINKRIEYYNQKRIKIKLKGLTPLEYRQLVLS